MNDKQLTQAIKETYVYAHNKCKYGRSDLYYPPSGGDNPVIDCVGLIFRAFYLLGKYPQTVSIDDIDKLCESVGMIKTTNMTDIPKHKCVVCFQHNHNIGTQHVNHVYYSLGGDDINHISKYDLGSNERIKAEQPFENVPVDEWDNMRFLYAMYFKNDFVSCNEFNPVYGVTGVFTANTNLYDGAGAKYNKIVKVKKNQKCIIYPIKVTSNSGNDFQFVTTLNGEKGFVYHGSVKKDSRIYYTGIVSNTDGTLNIRSGIGVDKPIITKVKEGSTVYVNSAIQYGDTLWVNITTENKISGFACAQHIKRSK